MIRFLLSSIGVAEHSMSESYSEIPVFFRCGFRGALGEVHIVVLVFYLFVPILVGSLLEQLHHFFVEGDTVAAAFCLDLGGVFAIVVRSKLSVPC